MCYSNNLIESLRESVRKSLSRRQGLHFCVIPMDMNITDTITYYTTPAPHQPFCCLRCWCRRRQHYLVKSKQYTRPLNVLLKIPQSSRPTHPLIQFLRHSHSPYCDSLCQQRHRRLHRPRLLVGTQFLFMAATLICVDAVVFGPTWRPWC